MSDIVTIRQSIAERILELESQIASLKDALSHLADSDNDSTPDPEPKDKDAAIVTDQPMPAKRNRKQMVRTKKVTAKKPMGGQRAMEIMELTNMGYTVSEIVDELGCHPNYVYTVRRSHVKAAA